MNILKKAYENIDFTLKAETRVVLLGTFVACSFLLIKALNASRSLILDNLDSAPLVSTVTLFGWLQLPTEIINWPTLLLKILSEHLSVIGSTSIFFVIPLLIIVSFFALLRVWFGNYYASVSTILLVSSSWFLGITMTSISALFFVLYTVVSLIAATNVYRGKTSGYLLVATVIPVGLYLGYHGIFMSIVQLVIITYVISKRRLSRPDKLHVALMSLIATILLLPFGWITWKLPQRIFEPIANINVLANASESLQFLSVGLQGNPFGWPQTWPLVDIGTGSLMLLGIMVAITRRKAVRYQIMLILLGLSVASFLIFGPSLTALGFTMVPLYVLFASGLRFLLESWKSVFPYNKAALLISHASIIVLLIAISLYHLQRYTELLPQL